MQETVRSSFPKSTLIIIAHRLQTIADCTRIAIMSEGLLAEIGGSEAASLCLQHFSKGDRTRQNCLRLSQALRRTCSKTLAACSACWPRSWAPPSSRSCGAPSHAPSLLVHGSMVEPRGQAAQGREGRPARQGLLVALTETGRVIGRTEDRPTDRPPLNPFFSAALCDAG